LSQVRELIAVQRAVASTIISGMDGDFYTTLGSESRLTLS